MKKKPAILDFYAIEKPLFFMSALNGENLRRFVDRKHLLDYVITSIGIGQRCAVIGEQGTGKSSFLLKLMDMMKDQVYGDYLHFSFPMEESEKSRLYFLRKILGSILAIILKNDELLAHFQHEDLLFEIERLEYSIVVEKYRKTQKSVAGEIEGGIKGNFLSVLIPAEFKAKLNAKREKEESKSETKDYPIHNENTLFNSISKLLEKIPEPIVLFIDELDKVGRYPLESPEWDKEVMKILELSREIMVSDKLILVFALQNELYEKLSNAQTNQGDVSILGLINSFKKLEGFDLEFAYEAVTASLTYAGYKGGIDDLFEKGVIETVLLAVKGNPRLFMHYLIELSKNAFLKREPKISLELLKNLLFEIDGKMTQKRWNALKSETPALK